MSRFKKSSILLLSLGLVLIANRGLGNALEGRSESSVPSTANVVFALDCGVDSNCASGNAQSALTVRHITGGDGTTDVEPYDLTNEVWNVVAHYLTAYGDPLCNTCEEVTASCTVTVRRNGAAFQLVNTTCNAAPFVAGVLISSSVCNVGLVTSAHAYKIGVTMADTVVHTGCVGGSTSAFINRVNYSLSGAPDGLAINTGCATGMTVLTPVYSTYATNDNGAFECTQSMPYGPEIGITY